MILVSGCLLGINCKYNGGNNKCEKLLDILDKYGFIPVCPEQLGGMTTPRKPNEIIIKDEVDQGTDCIRVADKEGKDNTKHFLRGAVETLNMAKKFNIKYAILKERSPSCGSNFIYDGTFTGKVVKGMGVTAKMLSDNGIKVYSEDQIDEFIQDIEKSKIDKIHSS
ncbi:DUF523 domain-containing protein [Clostridium thermarum]|uniref:DUF523 domain-containing protein n=1 Tax=Clostridium thermarum TaxID=1716543 RepID=UPI0013D52C60|nr:DUF523 domain-containing protein [Clostridium thermarum]